LTTLSTLSAIALIHLLAIASPGPTLAVVTSYAAGDRRSGFLVTLGVCLATICWASLAAAGLATVFATFPTAYRALQLAGAAYLIWLGIKLLRSVLQVGVAGVPSASHELPSAGWGALRVGFLTNITNPKVVAYYASLFGVLIPSDAALWLFWPQLQRPLSSPPSGGAQSRCSSPFLPSPPAISVSAAPPIAQWAAF
jgi:threonine efflux protein